MTTLQTIRERCEKVPRINLTDYPADDSMAQVYNLTTGGTTLFHEALLDGPANYKIINTLNFLLHARTDMPLLLDVIEVLMKACEYTQRTDVVIGHETTSNPDDDGLLRGMPDKIMMRNRCQKALAQVDAMLKGER